MRFVLGAATEVTEGPGGLSCFHQGPACRQYLGTLRERLLVTLGRPGQVVR